MVNYYFKDELYHHGVKGMKWGRRKRKEVKIKAKGYQRRLNELETQQNALHLNGWLMADSKEVTDKKIKEFERKGKTEKKKEFQLNSNILNKKIKDVEKQSSIKQKEIDSLLDKISKDKDLVYATSLWRDNPSRYKDFRNTSKSLSKKYGNESRYFSSSTGVKSVNSNRYIIKPATERNKKKKKFNDPYRKRSHRRYVETYYYMV